jgi:phosphate transport system permease protein
VRRGRIQEVTFTALMVLSLAVVLAALVGIVAVVLIKGGPALSLEMVTQTPGSGYYLGGGGGILNAIVGSLWLALSATCLAFVISIAVATYLQREFSSRRLAGAVRAVLELLWGIPSIVYGVICFVIMVFMGLGTSLLAGIIALTLLEIPIMTRVMDEALISVPADLKVSAQVLGSNNAETAARVVWRQAAPGLLSAVLLAFGRGIGDAASILFTAGFTDYIPRSLTDSVAALPTMIFFLSTSPLPEVRNRAYAAAFVLLAIVLVVSVSSRLLSQKFSRYVVK